MNTIMIIIALVLYLGIMVYIGFTCNKKDMQTDDFYLGGRQLSPLVTAMSAEASDMSAYLLMGIPGLALATGLAEAFWTALGLSVGTYLNWLFVSKRLRIYTEKLNAITVPEFLAKRFGDHKNIIGSLAAVIIIIFFVPYTASGFAACGKLFRNMFGMDYTFAMIMSAVIIIVYCTLGGFLAASKTDLIQSIVMTIALVVVLGIAEGCSNGFDGIIANVKNMDGYLDVFKGFNIGTGETGSYGVFPVVTTLAWGLGYFGMPHILLRFMAIENPDKLKTSRRIATIWVVISMGIAILIGVAGYAMMNNGIVGPYTTNSEAETIIVDISSFLATKGYIPALAAGVFIAGILAATMSTSDSQLIAASSSITQDLLQNTFKMKLSGKTKMILARVSVIIIAIIAVFLARNPDASVFRIVSFAWAGFGAAFGPVVLFALFWRRINYQGAFAGMLAGGITVFVWKFGIAKLGGVFTVYELLPAFIVGCIAIVVVSLLTPYPFDYVCETYDAVQDAMKTKNK